MPNGARRGARSGASGGGVYGSNKIGMEVRSAITDTGPGVALIDAGSVHVGAIDSSGINAAAGAAAGTGAAGVATRSNCCTATGFVVPPGDPPALAAALVDVLAGGGSVRFAPHLRGEAARFSWATMAAAVHRLGGRLGLPTP